MIGVRKAAGVQYWPKAVQALRMRGLVRFELQDYKGAVSDCTEALKLEPFS